MLRVYGLRGRTRSIAWCRDKASDWASELEAGRQAQVLADLRLLSKTARAVRRCLPWKDRFVEAEISDGHVNLPRFARSIVVDQEH